MAGPPSLQLVVPKARRTTKSAHGHLRTPLMLVAYCILSYVFFFFCVSPFAFRLLATFFVPGQFSCTSHSGIDGTLFNTPIYNQRAPPVYGLRL